MAVRYRLFSFYDELGLSRTAQHFLNAAYTSFAPLNDPPTLTLEMSCHVESIDPSERGRGRKEKEREERLSRGLIRD